MTVYIRLRTDTIDEAAELLEELHRRGIKGDWGHTDEPRPRSPRHLQAVREEA